MSAPPDPREERYRPLVRLLMAGIIGVGLLGVVALLLGEDRGEGVAVVMVVLLVGLPLVRVAWFVGRWFRRGDTRYAMVGVAVLCVPLVGYLLSR
ncbi:MAG: hypothetical protein GY812_12075 [Actinomycetia bacterium]|nr:hypothetical protein [Actinomycetes bacterium]